MTCKPAHGRIAGVVAAALAAWLGCLPQPARADAIYKCVDAAGRVTYQSSACSNGRAIDIAPGAFDADAAQRLREDAAEWNRRDDLRRALDAEAERARPIDAAAPAEPPATPPACTYCDDWNAAIVWPYPPWKPRPPRPPRRPVVTPPGYIVIR